MSVEIVPPEDAEFEEACGLADQVTEKIQTIEDVESIGAMAGGQGVASGFMGGGSGSGNTINLYIILKEDKELSNEKIVEEITELTKDLKGEINVSSSMMDMGMLAGDGLTVQIKGRELEKLQKIAADVKEIVSKVEGTAEAATGAEDTENEFRITVNKEKAAKYGMSVALI